MRPDSARLQMSRVLDWISSFPALQQEAVREAIDSASLAKVRRALRLFDELEPQRRGPAFQVDLVSTFNLEPLQPVLQLALSCLPSRPTICLAPLNSVEAHLAQSSEKNVALPLDARLVIWRVEELLPEALYPFTHSFSREGQARLEQVRTRVEGVISLHQKSAAGVPLFISTVVVPVHVGNRISAASERAALFGSISSINQKIYELAAAKSGVHVLDLNSWAAGEGRGYTDPALDLMARQPLSARGQIAFALFVARSLRRLIVPHRKALAIDLDDTVWGGVIGEEGVAGLVLGHDFPGNVHLRIQRELLELRHRGIALVMLSKNNESDVRQAFETLPDMLLTWGDFVVHKVNWKPKHENLTDAARDLGLGLNSFAFFDDSDYEREQMRQLLPDVLILNDSSDPLRNLRALWETDAFDSLVVTEEDLQRHHDYKIRDTRDIRAHRDDLELFLQSLEMKATIEPIGPHNLDRVVTLLAKTNQFNLTTRRHTRAQVQVMLNLPGSIALALRLRDKFGDQGLVALLLATPAREDKTLLIDSLLVSCRALGRGVEKTLWAAMLDRADEQGFERLEAEYRPTARNGLAAGFYPELGLEQVSADCSAIRYSLQPIERRPFPPWMALAESNHGR
jgi:FkbH-like protein